MTQAKWVEFCTAVCDRMTTFVAPSVTPISRSKDMKHGLAWGTGSYLRLPSGTSAILTNDHVARQVESEHLSHLPVPNSHFEVLPEFRAMPEPEDLAVCPIPMARLGNDRRLLSMACFDSVFSPVNKELLFLLGFPGTKAFRHDAITQQNTRYSWFGQLQNVGMPMVTQQVPAWPKTLSGRFDAKYHAIVHYPSFSRRICKERKVGLPNPAGLSGTLLWDTKAVANNARGQPWNPSKARVCGILWATWDNPEILVATRVEFLHAFIAEVDSWVT